MKVTAELGFSAKKIATHGEAGLLAMAKGGYDLPAWKHHLGCLAQGTIEGVDFEDSFGMAPDEFRTTVAGEQIDIIRNNPPDPDATHPQPGAQQANAESKLGKKRKIIRDHLRANAENTWLAFVDEDVATSTKMLLTVLPVLEKENTGRGEKGYSPRTLEHSSRNDRRRQARLGVERVQLWSK